MIFPAPVGVTARLSKVTVPSALRVPALAQRVAGDRIGAVERQAVGGADLMLPAPVCGHRQVVEGDGAVGVESAGIGQRVAGDRSRCR